MKDDKFDEVLAQAKENGLKIHPGISRKCVDGLHGMYATCDIPPNELLVSYPIDQLIHVDPSVQYTEEFADQWKYLHAAAKVLTEPNNHKLIFDSLYDLDFFKGFHVYFCEPEEFEVLKVASPVLYQFAVSKKTEIDYIINLISEFDPTISRDVLLWLTLNHQSRAWSDVGFVPILDLFNHSDELGLPRCDSDKTVFWCSKGRYQAGDQIWGNYGKRDIYFHAINFGYFDPNGVHSLDLGLRAAAVASTSQQKFALSLIKQKFKVRTQQLVGGEIEYKLYPSQAFFDEQRPSNSAIQYVMEESRGELTQQGNQIELLLRSRQRMMSYLSSLKESNKVELTSERDYPSKLVYLYHMLQKEKQVIENNLRWLSENPKLF